MITSFEYLKTCGLPVIVYGMGNGGDKVIDALTERGIAVSGVMASDGFVRGQSFRGFTVKGLSQIENEFPEFVIALAFASSLPEVMSHITAISIRHKMLVPSVPVYGKQVFDLDFYNEHYREIELARGILADEKSRFVYDSIVEFLLTGELDVLMRCESDKSEAFNSILKLRKDENYLDLGAYRGDTIAEFLEYSDNNIPPDDSFNGTITALEPDFKTFKKLRNFAGDFKNTLLLNKGISDKNGVCVFSAKSGRNSSLSQNISFPNVSNVNNVPLYGKGSPGGKSAEIEVTSVDSIAFELVRKPSYIKADVEGAESLLLAGAERTLRELKPKLNIAAYHRAEDIFTLIIQIYNINPQYNIYLRHHPYIPFWDTNLYCV